MYKLSHIFIVWGVYLYLKFRFISLLIHLYKTYFFVHKYVFYIYSHSKRYVFVQDQSPKRQHEETHIKTKIKIKDRRQKK